MNETDVNVLFVTTVTTTWKKQIPNPSPSTSLGMAPTGRRGHSAILYGDAMHVYGGYQDLRGSSSELWTFDFSEFIGSQLIMRSLHIN